MKIYVLNGPNINLLGTRETSIYGKSSYKDLIKMIKNTAKVEKIKVVYKQTNIEGELVSLIQKAYKKKVDGIVINPAAYTHTSIAILDALKATQIPAIEVHISDIDNREEFRRLSYTSQYCFKVIKGLGIDGYRIAIKELKEYLEKQNYVSR